jgi:hypothetical protein
MGGYQNNITQHGQLGDNFDTIHILCPTNPQYMYYCQHPKKYYHHQNMYQHPDQHPIHVSYQIIPSYQH